MESIMTNTTIYILLSKTEKFTQKSNIVHNNFYDYSMVDYKLSNQKVIIKCPIHGPFLQKPNKHLFGQGCPSCSGKNQTTKIFIDNAKHEHNNFYDYSMVDYKLSNQKVIIKCPIHGPFLQKPNKHLFGQGCPSCGIKYRIKLQTSSTEEFIVKASMKHNNLYDYSAVDYIANRIDVDIICHIHGSFTQTPDNHLSGRGCSSCAKRGFDKNKPAICYYIKFETENQILYKIGITNLTVNKRLSGMIINKGIKTSIIQELYFESGSDAVNMETRILKEFREFQYKGDPIMKNGNSELFIKDILELS